MSEMWHKNQFWDDRTYENRWRFNKFGGYIIREIKDFKCLGSTIHLDVTKNL